MSKRRASETLDSEPPRALRRLNSHRVLKIAKLQPEQLANGVAEDDVEHSSPQERVKVEDIIDVVDINESEQPMNTDVVSDTNKNSDITMSPNNETIGVIENEHNNTIAGSSVPQPRLILKIKIPNNQETTLDQGIEEQRPTTPSPTRERPRAPPASPSTHEDHWPGDPLPITAKPKDVMSPNGKVQNSALSTYFQAPSPTPLADLNEPPHHAPTPPYYPQFFMSPDEGSFEGSRDELNKAMPNANTWVRKARFNERKVTKSGPIWAFSDERDYPRGETPPIELVLQGGADSPNWDLKEGIRQPSYLSDTDSGDEADLTHDPGVAIALTVTTDPQGRFICKWGECNKTFARNDHLSRHVKVAHLRVRKHKCERCGIAFVGVKGLRGHLRGHKAAGEAVGEAAAGSAPPTDPNTDSATAATGNEPTATEAGATVSPMPASAS